MQIFEEMKVNKLQPTATTYGCLLMVCARQKNVEKAFELYEEAYSRGVLATDECHNILISICADAGRFVHFTMHLSGCPGCSKFKVDA